MISIEKKIKVDSKNKNLRCYSIFSLMVFSMLSFAIFSPAWSQSFYNPIANKSAILIKGTSNLHDWESKVLDITGEMRTSVDKNQIQKIESVIVKIPVTSIKSDKDAMDTKTYEALNSKKYPVITFQSKNISFTPNEITSTGDLTINGVTKSKVVKAAYAVKPDGNISVTGVAKVKMSDFGVKPPTALLGTIKAGNDIEIQFEVMFKSSKSINAK